MLGQWCMERPSNRTVVPASGDIGSQFSAGSTAGSVRSQDGPFDGEGEATLRMREGNNGQGPEARSNWPFPPPQLSPSSDAYGNSRMLQDRRSYWAGSPAYGGSSLFERSDGGVRPNGGPVTMIDLPRALRCGVPSDISPGTPLNVAASLEIAERTENLLTVIESCVFVDQKYPVSPMKVQPREGREFQEMNAIALSSVVADIETTVLSFRVPFGMEGNLNRVVFDFNGTGFVPGASSIIYRVRLNRTYVRNLGGVDFLYGSLQNQAIIVPGYGIKIVSGQTVTISAEVPTGSPVGGATARIIAGAFGWFFPRK